MAIAATAVGRLSAISVVSGLAGLDVRKAAADGHRGRGHQHWSNYWQRHEHSSPHWQGHGSGHRHRQEPAAIRCFGRGTLIQTSDGEVAVERLALGTPIVTMNGIRPVKWIARQTVRRNGAANWHASIVPVCVSRFALDDRTPRRDLYVSQEHTLFIDGSLIPVKHLVNGRSISFDDSVHDADSMEYFHIELDTHEVVFAEGAPTETFLYQGGAIAWDNIDEYRAVYGEHRIMSPYAPTRSYAGVLSELNGLLRLAASRFVDVRDPVQIAYDRLDARARKLAA
jgi:hypothetical protein